MKAPTMNLEEALRGLLLSGKAPETLRQRLLMEARRQERHLVPPWALAAAACLLLCLAGISTWRSFIRDPAPQLAQLAYAEYHTAQRLDFQGEPPSQGEGCCAQWSKRTLGFAAPLPSCVESCCVRGGRACRLARTPAAFYQLDSNRALYVFPEPIRRQPGMPVKLIALPDSTQARVWNEGGRGYLMLENRPR